MTDTERYFVASPAAARPEGRQGVNDYLLAMSHELRAPLNSVIGMSGLLLDDELSVKQRQYVKSINAAGEGLAMILNDVLDLCRVASSRVVIEPIPFDLKSMIEETARVLTPRANERGLALRVDWRPELARHVIGDPGRTRQVLGNLVGHAVNATSQGEVVIRVMGDVERNGTRSVRFVVEDTGIGIAPARLERIFEDYIPVDASPYRSFGVTGLGLRLAADLVRLMGGAIGAESQQGRGSQFWFSLPMPAAAPPVTALAEGGDLRSGRVLIVEADQSSRNRLVQQIGAAGWDADFNEDAEQLIDELREADAIGDPYQVCVISHYAVRPLHLDIATRLKADARLASTALVMIAAVGSPGDGKKLWHAGYTAYLRKPVSPEEMAETLNALGTVGPDGRSSSLITRHSLAEARNAQSFEVAGIDEMLASLTAPEVADRAEQDATAQADATEVEPPTAPDGADDRDEDEGPRDSLSAWLDSIPVSDAAASLPGSGNGSHPVSAALDEVDIGDEEDQDHQADDAAMEAEAEQEEFLPPVSLAGLDVSTPVAEAVDQADALGADSTIDIGASDNDDDAPEQIGISGDAPEQIGISADPPVTSPVAVPLFAGIETPEPDEPVIDVAITTDSRDLQIEATEQVEAVLKADADETDDDEAEDDDAEVIDLAVNIVAPGMEADPSPAPPVDAEVSSIKGLQQVDWSKTPEVPALDGLMTDERSAESIEIEPVDLASSAMEFALNEPSDEAADLAADLGLEHHSQTLPPEQGSNLNDGESLLAGGPGLVPETDVEEAAEEEEEEELALESAAESVSPAALLAGVQSLDALSWEMGDQLSHGGSFFVQHTVAAFLRETPGLIAELVTSAARADAGRMHTVFGRLETAAASVGGTRLAEIARRLAADTEAGNASAAASAMGTVEQAFLDTREALERANPNGLPAELPALGTSFAEQLSPERDGPGRMLALKLVDSFRSEAPARFADMRAAIAGGDADTSQRLAQTLKGMCGLIGAEPLAKLCALVEADARLRRVSQAERYVAPIEVELDRVQQALNGARGE